MLLGAYFLYSPPVSQSRSYEEGLKALREEESALDALGKIEAEFNRFEELMEVQETGGLYRKYAPNSIQGAFDAEIEEMIAIADRLTPFMRNGLPGASSDKDVTIFRGASVGPDKKPQTNRNIIAGYRAQAENARARLAFRQAYLDENRTLSGADEAWREYLEANSIFAEDSTPQNIKLNEKRKTWRQHFGLEPSSPESLAPQIDQMDLEQLEQMDPDTLTPEEREAAAKRWDELNGG